MSHYSVAVIVKQKNNEEEIFEAVGEMLQPFNENIQVSPYIIQTKEEVKKEYENYLNGIGMYENEDKDNKKSCDEFVSLWFGYDLDSEGNALSTYNPLSKWDWYEIGGRWNKFIETKDGCKVNYAKIKDIVFKKSYNDLQIHNFKKEYKELTTKGDFYKPEYYKEKFPNLESYIETQNFSTYAILDSYGNWYEPGKMGWFGISHASIKEENEFEKTYIDIINKENPESYIVIVDCHI